MKKILIMLLFIALPIVIYVTNVDKKVYYIALGDSLAAGTSPYGQMGYSYDDYVSNYLKKKKVLEFYTKTYATPGYRTTDLIRDINNNRKIEVDGKELAIKNALTKADLVTISIGSNDLFYKLGIHSMDLVMADEDTLEKYADEVLIDLESLVVLIKKYCKEDLVIVGYYNPLWQRKSTYSKEVEPVFLHVNSEMKQMAKKYKFYYVDVYEMFKTHDNYLPNPLDIHPSTAGYSAISKEIIKIIDKYVLN